MFVYLCVSTGVSGGQAMEEPACVGASPSALHQLCLLVRHSWVAISGQFSGAG